PPPAPPAPGVRPHLPRGAQLEPTCTASMHRANAAGHLLITRGELPGPYRTAVVPANDTSEPGQCCAQADLGRRRSRPGDHGIGRATGHMRDDPRLVIGLDAIAAGHTR